MARANTPCTVSQTATCDRNWRARRIRWHRRPTSAPAQVTRLLRRLHAHGLVAKIPHSRRWMVSLAGRRTMTTAIKLREVAYPSLFAAAA